MKIVSPAHSVGFQGVRLNVYHANVGEGLPRHEHDYPHLTMCMAGACEVRKSGKSLLLTPKSQPVYLLGREWHEIEAVQDGTVFQNVFASSSV